MNRGRLAAIRREAEECTVLMKTFCLDPTVECYRRISKCAQVTRGEYYLIWCSLLPFDDAERGGNGTVPPHVIRDIAFRAILLKASEGPTKTIAMQLLYMYAATGWFAAIEKFYECMGDSRLAHNVRVELSKEYKEWKELYAARIHQLKTVNRDHFTSRGIDQSAVDFSRFDMYQREYESRKK